MEVPFKETFKAGCWRRAISPRVKDDGKERRARAGSMGKKSRERTLLFLPFSSLSSPSLFLMINWSILQKSDRERLGARQLTRRLEGTFYARRPGYTFLCPWHQAQLFEDRLALNPGLNLILFLFLLFKSIFSDNFLCYFEEHPSCWQKELNWIYFLSFQIWIQISH